MIATRSALPRKFPRKFLAIVLASAALFAACAPSYDSTIGVNLVNWERSARNISTVNRAADLDYKAQTHAEWMARNKTLAHSNLTDHVMGNYTYLAENVGVGSSIANIHVAFMNSSTHKANILDGRFHSIGFGEARASNGQIYVAMVFKG